MSVPALKPRVPAAALLQEGWAGEVHLQPAALMQSSWMCA